MSDLLSKYGVKQDSEEAPQSDLLAKYGVKKQEKPTAVDAVLNIGGKVGSSLATIAGNAVQNLDAKYDTFARGPLRLGLDAVLPGPASHVGEKDGKFPTGQDIIKSRFPQASPNTLKYGGGAINVLADPAILAGGVMAGAKGLMGSALARRAAGSVTDAGLNALSAIEGVSPAAANAGFKVMEAAPKIGKAVISAPNTIVEAGGGAATNIAKNAAGGTIHGVLGPKAGNLAGKIAEKAIDYVPGLAQDHPLVATGILEAIAAHNRKGSK